MKTQSRRTELEVGPEMMLKVAGWRNIAPAGAPPWMKCWVNPRTGKSYTLDGATAIEQLKETL